MGKKKLNSKEKHLILNSKPKLKKMWYVVLVLLGINIIFTVLFYMGILYKTEGPLMLLIILPAIILLSFIFWGAYKLHDWPIVFFWIWFLSALRNYDILSIIMAALILFFYYYILKNIKIIGKLPDVNNELNSVNFKKHEVRRGTWLFIVFLIMFLMLLISFVFFVFEIDDKYYDWVLNIGVGVEILSLYMLVRKDSKESKKPHSN
jgi:hypothetical protein